MIDKGLILQRLPKSFKHGVRVLMLIDRSKQNSNKGSKRWINKIITTNPDEFDIATDKLVALQNHLDNPDIRLYSTVNARNMQKSIVTFKHKQLDLTEDNECIFYKRINDSFCSCLMKPENKAERLFLIDVDTKDERVPLGWMTKNREINMFYTYPTPNGSHIITEPFNPSLCDGIPDFEVKKDALMLLNWIEKND